ncbi:MAG: hypothetical protein V1822_03010 [Candidatus Micrarchaeota archaeon]
MAKLALAILLFSLLLIPIYAEDLGLSTQKCSDGTAYYKCSQPKPGYICAPDGQGGLSLQNVIGEAYPSDFPVASKAGQPTENAIKCACSNFPGYEERGGQCLKPGEQAAPQDNSGQQGANGQNMQANDSGAQNNSAAAQNNTQAGAQNTSSGSQKTTSQTSQKAQPLQATAQKVPQQQAASSGFDLGTWGLVGIGLGVSAICGVLIIAVIAGILFYAYKMKKKN